MEDAVSCTHERNIRRQTAFIIDSSITEDHFKYELNSSINLNLELGELVSENRHLQTMLTNAQIGFTDPLEQV